MEKVYTARRAHHHEISLQLKDLEEMVVRAADARPTASMADIDSSFSRVQMLLQEGEGDTTARALVLTALLQVAEMVSIQYFWLSFGKKLLEKLVDFCNDLKASWECKHWTAYNVYLTVLAARQGSDILVTRLREQNSAMKLKDIVSCDPSRFSEPGALAISRCGLALQACKDVKNGASLEGIGPLPIISLGWALLEVNSSTSNLIFPDEWLFLLSKVFPKGGRVQDFSQENHTDIAIRLVKAVLDLQNNLKERGEEESSAHDMGDEIWGTVLRSLSFLGLVKATKVLFDECKITRSLVHVAKRLLSNQMEDANDDAASDAAAFKELRTLLHSVQDCKEIYIDEKEGDGTRERLFLALAAVVLYMMVVLTVARAKTRHKYVMEAAELRRARAWLLRLREELKAGSENIDGSVRCDYVGRAAAALDLAMALVMDPTKYTLGIPFFV